MIAVAAFIAVVRTSIFLFDLNAFSNLRFAPDEDLYAQAAQSLFQNDPAVWDFRLRSLGIRRLGFVLPAAVVNLLGVDELLSVRLVSIVAALGASIMFLWICEQHRNRSQVSFGYFFRATYPLKSFTVLAFLLFQVWPSLNLWSLAGVRETYVILLASVVLFSWQRVSYLGNSKQRKWSFVTLLASGAALGVTFPEVALAASGATLTSAVFQLRGATTRRFVPLVLAVSMLAIVGLSLAAVQSVNVGTVRVGAAIPPVAPSYSASVLGSEAEVTEVGQSTAPDRLTLNLPSLNCSMTDANECISSIMTRVAWASIWPLPPFEPLLDSTKYFKFLALENWMLFAVAIIVLMQKFRIPTREQVTRVWTLGMATFLIMGFSIFAYHGGVLYRHKSFLIWTLLLLLATTSSRVTVQTTRLGSNANP